jgi:hypothetical protein
MQNSGLTFYLKVRPEFCQLKFYEFTYYTSTGAASRQDAKGGTWNLTK